MQTGWRPRRVGEWQFYQRTHYPTAQPQICVCGVIGRYPVFLRASPVFVSLSVSGLPVPNQPERASVRSGITRHGRISHNAEPGASALRLISLIQI
jgi:hypothetical protein